MKLDIQLAGGHTLLLLVISTMTHDWISLPPIMVMMLAFSLDMVMVLFKIKLDISLAMRHSLSLLVILTMTLD